MSESTTTYDASGLRSADPSLVTYTHVIYGLHALTVLIGLTSSVFVVTAFLTGLPSIVAVIMNYVRQGDARGTYLESHFRWQIRTFWFALLWTVVAAVISMPLMLVVIGIFTMWAAAMAIGLWVVYRVARGWLALRDGRSMPLPA
jgi:uncharacterized membrane protein